MSANVKSRPDPVAAAFNKIELDFRTRPPYETRRQSVRRDDRRGHLATTVRRVLRRV
jgi:hypothetical protein